MEKSIKNLCRESEAYYENNDFYEIFSQAEDSTREVERYLQMEARGKIVLDAGCGTGKFLPSLELVSTQYIGVDLSKKQLEKAVHKKNKSTSIFLQSNLSSLDLDDHSIDLIVCTWVLGTVSDCLEREQCLNELRRVLKPNGKIILVENAEGSEFEEVRGRTRDNRTREYNHWILEQGFVPKKEFYNYFLFEDLGIVKKCFEIIYGDEVSSKIHNRKIEHKIVIFESK